MASVLERTFIANIYPLPLAAAVRWASADSFMTLNFPSRRHAKSTKINRTTVQQNDRERQNDRLIERQRDRTTHHYDRQLSFYCSIVLLFDIVEHVLSFF